MNVTIDDVSPVIQYLSQNNSWLLGGESLASYFDSSFHTTTTDGDQAVVKFNGTACYFFGSNWDNHGAYSAQLDDLPVEYFLGYSADRKFQQVIYSATGLDANVEHTVTLTNLPSRTDPPANATIEWFFDIDYVVITTATTGQVYTTMFDDSDDVFTYGPGWKANTAQKTPPYYELTMHLTDQTNAQAEFRFNGTSVALYGGVNANHGNYTFAIDGVTGPSTSGRHTTLVVVPLFFASNLVDGPHVMTITNVATDQPDLDIDYAIVNSTINPQNGNTTTSTGSPSENSGTSGSASDSNTGNVTLSGDATGSSHSASAHAGAIAKGVVGGLVGLGLVAVLAWWLFRKRSRAPTLRASFPTPKEIGRIDLNGPAVERYGGEEVKPYPVDIPAYTTSYTVSYVPSRSASSVTSDTHYQRSQPGHSAESGFLSSIPPPPASTATSYVHSERRTSDVPIVPPVPRSVASVRTSNTAFPGVATRSAASTASPTNESPTSAQIKGAMVAVPYTAQVPAQWGSNRLVREDREQDAGPAGMYASEAARRVTLPPDYEQATEPLPGQVPPLPSSREGM